METWTQDQGAVGLHASFWAMDTWAQLSGRCWAGGPVRSLSVPKSHLAVGEPGWWSAEKELLPCPHPPGNSLHSLPVETCPNHAPPCNAHAQPPATGKGEATSHPHDS